MYLSFYGLNEKPFDISTDPKFLWLGDKHKEAFAILKYGVIDNKGFLLLTGDVGAGKTTLINALVNSVSEDVIIAFIPDPGLELMEFYRYLAHEFNFDNSFNNKADFIFIFREFLHHAHSNAKRVLLIIDEAQRLTNSLLEEIRLLSNLELQNTKLLNIFFVGQAEFNTKLLEPDNRAVRQRITISNHIQPLTEKETGDYIRHRLKVAGSQKNIFSYVAIHEVHKFSGGLPRLINIVCDIALLTGYVREAKKISDDIVIESIESISIEHPEHVNKIDSVQESAMTVASALEVRNGEDIQPTPLKTGGIRIRPVFVGVLISIVLMVGAVRLYYPSVSVRFMNTAIIHDIQKKLIRHNETEQHLSNGRAMKIDQHVSSSVSLIKPVDSLSQLSPENKLILDFGNNTNDVSKENYSQMTKLSEYLKSNPEMVININGYTDDKGMYSTNINLSQLRANNVKSFFIGQGIDINRIKVKGYGPDKPRATNATEEGRRQNRRVEIEVDKGSK